MIILLDGKPSSIFPVKSHDAFIFSIKQESGRAYWTLKSLKYKASPILSGGLARLLLKFNCQKKWVKDVMKEIMENFYLNDFAGHLVEDDDNEGKDEVGR